MWLIPVIVLPLVCLILQVHASIESRNVRIIAPSPTVTNQGRVEVFIRGVWGTVCDTGWSIEDANVVCRQLGLEGAQQAIPNGFYSTGDLQPIITNVQCAGHEVSLTSCRYERMEHNTCDPGAIAGVVCHVRDEEINLRRMRASQSTTTHDGVARRAIDGIESTVWTRRSCTHTDISDVKPAWWKVDLGGEKCITKVKLLNRQDCCEFRLIDSIVRIGSHQNTSENMQCGGPVTAEQARPGALIPIRCHVPLRGRYISVHSGLGVNPKQNVLTLCEVKAYETDMPCADPAVYPQGFKFIRLLNGSTSYEGRIKVYHNGQWGSICDRHWDISDANVACRDLGFLRASAAIPRSFYGSGNLDIILTNVQCSGEESSFYFCQHDGWNNSAACASNHVAGVSCFSRGTAITLSNKRVAQSSLASRGNPERAIDGNINPHYSGDSCTHTGNEVGPWWRIDLEEQHCIKEVVITNRAGCCYDRLIDTIVKVGSYDDVSNATLCSMPVTAAEALPGVPVSVLCARPISGRYVFVQGGKGTESATLTICEIQISEDTNSDECEDDLSGSPRVRLIGSSPLKGQVEIYKQGIWGGICSDHWDLNDAHVVCRYLGSEQAISVSMVASGSSKGPDYKIWLDNVQCTGEELLIESCPHDGWGNYDCTSEELAAVECAPRQNAISLYGKPVRQSTVRTEGGEPERAIDGNRNSNFNRGQTCTHTGYASDTGEWRTDPQWRGPWWSIDLQDYYCISKVQLVNRGDCCHLRLVDTIVRVGNNETYYHNRRCGYPVTEEQALPGALVTVDCLQPICGRYVSVHGGFGVNEATLTLCEVMVYSTDCEEQCDSDTISVFDSHPIRLANGHADYEGRVEVYHNNTWGSICDESWNIDDANVVCKQLGFEGAVHALGSSYFGANEGKVWLSNVQCTGHEDSIFKCVYDGFEDIDCRMDHIASVKCAIPKFEVSIAGKPTSQSSTSTNGNADKAADGNTDTNFYHGSCTQTNNWQEIGPWWKVDLMEEQCITRVVIVNRADCCHDRLVDTIVRVGLNNDTSLNSQCGEPISSDQAEPGAWIKINCTQPLCGRYVSIHGGQGTKKAILSLCEVQVFATECPETCRLHHGPIDGNFVRLADGDHEWEGRVEIYHRREWRSVCGIGWNRVNANIVCRELGFLSATNALQSSRYGSGQEPVWLSNVFCTGEEDSLSQCLHGGWGNTSCPDGSRAAIMACGLPSDPVTLDGNHATQSSVSNGGEPRLAVDGNANPDFDYGSCIHTAGEERPDVPAWWGVDLDSVRCVARVDIRNRQDCCSDYLANAIVLVGNSNDLASDDLWTCGQPVTTRQAQPGHWVSVSCDVPIMGRYLFIVGGFGIQASTLTFCEVMVYEAQGISACMPTSPKPRTSSRNSLLSSEAPTSKITTFSKANKPAGLYCQETVMSVSDGRLSWPKALPGTVMGSDETCRDDSIRGRQPKATRYCTIKNGTTLWMDPIFVSCDDATKSFQSNTDNGSSIPEVHTISSERMIPLSDRAGCIVTALLLFITLLMLFLFSNLGNIGSVIQINYCISLLLFNLIFAVGINTKDSQTICVIVATLLHLFMMASVTWLAVDLRHVFLSITFKLKEQYFVAKYCLLAWGTSILTAAVTLGISFHADENIGLTCFLAFGPGMLYGIVLPFILIIIYMLYISCLIIHELRQHRNAPARNTVACNGTVQRFKCNVVLVVLTVITWCLVFIYLNLPSPFITTLFTTADIILGISVLLLFCCYQTEKRHRLQTVIFRAKNPHMKKIGDEDGAENENSVTIHGMSNPLLDESEVELKGVDEERGGEVE